MNGHRLGAVKVIRALNDEISDLEPRLTASFEAHPDTEIYRSLPGLGVVLGARVMAEFGDDRDRYKSLRRARTSPARRRSRKRREDARRCCAGSPAITGWPMPPLPVGLRLTDRRSPEPGVTTTPDSAQSRANHPQALPALANRFVGILHGCIRYRQNYAEVRAWGGIRHCRLTFTPVGCLALASWPWPRSSGDRAVVS